MEKRELIEDFLNIFQLLTPKQQKIWRYLQSFAKVYRNVFPSQSKIAEACKCHRDTVIQAIKKFKQLGWISVLKRAYTSCVYFISDVLISINTLNPKTFIKNCVKKNFPTHSDTEPTVINNTFHSSNEYVEFDRIVQNMNLHKYYFSQKDMKLLTAMSRKNYQCMEKAVQDLKSLEKQEKINNPSALLTTRFKFHLEFKNSNISEEIKYLNISHKDKILLSRYNQKDRKSFMLAYEDFKSYSIFRKVNNISAFITSRFKEYFNDTKIKKSDHLSNKEYAKNLISNLKIPNNISIQFFNKFLEIVYGNSSKCFYYEEKNFITKTNYLLKKLNISMC